MLWHFTLCRGLAAPVGSVVSFGALPGTFPLPKRLDGGERVGAQPVPLPYGTEARAVPLSLGTSFGSSRHGSTPDFSPRFIV